MGGLAPSSRLHSAIEQVKSRRNSSGNFWHSRTRTFEEAQIQETLTRADSLRSNDPLLHEEKARREDQSVPVQKEEARIAEGRRKKELEEKRQREEDEARIAEDTRKKELEEKRQREEDE